MHRWSSFAFFFVSLVIQPEKRFNIMDYTIETYMKNNFRAEQLLSVHHADDLPRAKYDAVESLFTQWQSDEVLEWIEDSFDEVGDIEDWLAIQRRNAHKVAADMLGWKTNQHQGKTQP